MVGQPRSAIENDPPYRRQSHYFFPLTHPLSPDILDVWLFAVLEKAGFCKPFNFIRLENKGNNDL